jgi:hypothetical protein
MFNAHFKQIQNAIRGKPTLQILKLTKSFLTRCDCGRTVSCYGAAQIECGGCGLKYMAGSVREEEVNISGEVRKIPIVVGRCPKCHKRNISRNALKNNCVPECRVCKDGNRIILPINMKSLANIPPLELFVESDYVQMRMHLTYGQLDAPSLLCRIKTMA